MSAVLKKKVNWVKEIEREEEILKEKKKEMGKRKTMKPSKKNEYSIFRARATEITQTGSQ